MNTFEQCFTTLRTRTVSNWRADCTIKTNVVLLQFSPNYYIVLSTEQTCSDCTDDMISTGQWTFTNKEEAIDKFNKVGADM